MNINELADYLNSEILDSEKYKNATPSKIADIFFKILKRATQDSDVFVVAEYCTAEDRKTMDKSVFTVLNTNTILLKVCKNTGNSVDIMAEFAKQQIDKILFS